MRIVLIGFGNIARRHIEVFEALGCEIVASCNRSDANNVKAMEEGKISRTYNDYFKMIDVEKPDAIINCASFDKIFDVTRDLIPMGIPMLIEKPAGTSLTELDELIAIQSRYGTTVQVAMNRRHYSVIRKALEYVGGQDKINMLSIEWSENPAMVKQKRGYDDRLMGRLLYGNSVHGLDMLCHYAGGISDFEVMTRTSEGYFNWNMMIVGKSRKNVLVDFKSSWVTPIPWKLTIYTNDLRCQFAPLETCKVFSGSEENPAMILPENHDTVYKAGFYDQARSFIHAIALKKSEHDLLSCRDSMTLAEGLYSSLAK